MKEYYYDKLLNIKTGGKEKDNRKSFHYYPYEPSEYRVLEILLDTYQFEKNDCIVDFGAGKGRMCFFINYFKHVAVKGIEMNEAFYQAAIRNKNNYVKKTNEYRDNIQFYCCLAESYEIKDSDNRFYFFNPFSIQIFMKVINNILFSVEKSKRVIELVLYYASKDYIDYLENDTIFELKKEIVIPSLYEHDLDERFLVYQLPLF